ncbi:MAG: sulfotransferase [Kiloniellaceae bacterium]
MNFVINSTLHAEPFFVLGVQRSGTTMLRLMLNNHPELAVPHETVFITQFYRKLENYGDLAKADNRRALLDDIAAHPLVVRGKLIPDKDFILAREPQSYGGLIDAIMSAYAEARGKSRWGDKTPYYTQDIDVLNSIFPRAKFIQVLRDGRDVALSQRRIEWCSTNSFRLAQDWRWKTTLCHKVGRVLGPDRYLELRYEELVHDPEFCLRRACEFLGEEFSIRMLHYHETAKDVVPAESLRWHQNSVQPPDESKIFAWKTALPETDRVIFEEIAGDTLDYFGYERGPLNSTFRTKLRKMYLTVVQRW